MSYSLEQLEKQVRTLQKRLERSERYRAQLEDLRDKDQGMHTKMHAEIEAARRTIEQKNAELEHRHDEIVAQRDALQQALRRLKAAQAQLVQSEKMASLGQLTAGIAHEIKNPLNFINNFADVIVELTDELVETFGDAPPAGPPDAPDLVETLQELQLFARRILEHGQRTDAIVRGMLAHSSGKAGQRELIAINELLGEYVNLAYHGMRAHQPDFHVALRRAFDPAAGEVEGVPQELGQVFINLLNNAFDALHEASARSNGTFVPEVVVGTRALDDGVEIRVVDNGPGIPEAVRERIFEPFFTTKPTGTGTGLGLSLSYDIISQGHAGTMRVEDAPDGGAAFVVTLPRR